MIGAAWCALMVVLAACTGGDGRLTAAGYAREASALCSRANHAVARLEVTDPGLGYSVSRMLRRVVDVHRESIDDLRDLRPPERLAGIAQRWIALLDQGVDELEVMREQLQHGRERAATAYGVKATSLLERARELVTPLDITSCRGPDLPGA